MAADAGLGAILTQKQQNNQWLPIAYTSRALTPTESRYTQIKKEALAITYACERFQEYLIGKSFHIHTDHKPLVPIFSTKRLEELPLRVQRFRLRLLRFCFTTSHIPGKGLTTADTLSRAPLQSLTPADTQLRDDCAVYVALEIANLPATESRIREALKQDEICQLLIRYCENGWPAEVTGPIKQSLPVKSELTVANGMLIRGSRLIIPSSMRPEILQSIHSGHQGITKFRESQTIRI